jgi:hypothetical protein
MGKRRSLKQRYKLRFKQDWQDEELKIDKEVTQITICGRVPDGF